MTYADRIRQAKSQPEAMLAIAEGLDELLSRVEAAGVPSREPESQWATWGGGAGGVASDPPSPEPSPFEVIKVKVDPAELADARDRRHQAESNYEALSARGPAPGQGPEDWNAEKTDALTAMRRAQSNLRLLEDPGAIINDAGFMPGSGELTTTSESAGQLLVDLPKADERRRRARRKLAESIDLPGFFPSIYRTGAAAEAIIHAYELGGPIWLNGCGQFDNAPPVIMQMPTNVRQAMVADVMMDSMRLGYELARTILKDQDVGATLDVTATNVESIFATGNQVYEGKGDA